MAGLMVPEKIVPERQVTSSVLSYDRGKTVKMNSIVIISLCIKAVKD